MKWIAFVFITISVILLMLGCGDNGVEHVIDPPDTLDVITFDNFDDNNAQNGLGETFGTYKIANLGDPSAIIDWGGGFWYAYASGNGAKVISGAGDTIINGPGTVEDNHDILAKLITGGKLYVELNCQGLTGTYWAGIGCDLAGDYNHPYKFDSLANPNDNTVYWDLSSIDSVRIQMRGMGAVLFFFESKAVKEMFPNPDDAWGFHGDSIVFGEVMADHDSTYSFAASDFITTSAEAATVSWADASKNISAFVVELDTEHDDRLEIEIDKIEFVGLDTTVAFPFIQ